MISPLHQVPVQQGQLPLHQCLENCCGPMEQLIHHICFLWAAWCSCNWRHVVLDAFHADIYRRASHFLESLERDRHAKEWLRLEENLNSHQVKPLTSKTFLYSSSGIKMESCHGHHAVPNTHTHIIVYLIIFFHLWINWQKEPGVRTTKTKQQYVILRHFQDIIDFCESLFSLKDFFFKVKESFWTNVKCSFQIRNMQTCVKIPVMSDSIQIAILYLITKKKRTSFYYFRHLYF